MSEAFVVSRRDLDVDDDRGVRFRIPAGSLRREDDVTVRQHPELFYVEQTHRFRVELTQLALDDGRQLGVIERDYEIAGPPAPDDPMEALRQVEQHWQKQLAGEGLLTLYAQRTDTNAWCVRAEVTRDVPAPPTIVINVPPQPPPVVNVQVDSEPVDATVEFQRNPDGTLASAAITGTPDTDDVGTVLE